MHNALCKWLWYKYLNHVCVKQWVPVCVKLTACFCGGFNPASFLLFLFYYYYFSNTWNKSSGNSRPFSMNTTHSKASVVGWVPLHVIKNHCPPEFGFKFVKRFKSGYFHLFWWFVIFGVKWWTDNKFTNCSWNNVDLTWKHLFNNVKKLFLSCLCRLLFSANLLKTFINISVSENGLCWRCSFSN